MPADDVTHEVDGNGARTRAEARHAASRKPLISRLHLPAGKVIAIAAMPSAVLMGLGFTPTLGTARADDAPTAKNLTAEEFQDCVEVLGEDAKTAKDGEAEDAAPSPSPSAGKDGGDGTGGGTSGTGGGQGTTEGSGSGSGSTGSSGTGTSSGSGSTGSSGSGSAADTAPDPGTTTATEEPAPSPSPAETPAASSTEEPSLLGSVGDALGSLLGTDAAETAEPSASPSPSPSASSASEEQTADVAKSAGTTATSDSGSSTSTSSDTVTKTVDTVTGTAGDTAGKTVDDAGKTVQETEDTVKAADSAADSPSPSPSPSASDGVDPDDCPVATDEEGGLEDIVALPDAPWYLEASSLQLNGADYQGIVQVRTANGTVKKVLKYVVSAGTDIGDLHQTVNDPASGKTYHVQAADGTTSTIRDGDTVMYTESISGKLFGLLPVTFSPDEPPPLNPPLVYFTDVKVTQAGQFGGSLSVPGLHQYTTPYSAPSAADAD